MTVRRYPKGSTQYVQPNFQVDEFSCKCGTFQCQTTLIDDDLALGLQLMHNALLLPIHITEGYRCAVRQQQLRDAKNSDGTPMYETAKGRSPHEDGLAADIKAGKLSGHELEAAARKAGFLAVGRGLRWVHVDTRQGKTRSWTYKT